MIYSGDSSIADAKYGSTQLTRIYHGSDLVWENADYKIIEFPNNLMQMTSASNTLGFTITDDADSGGGEAISTWKFFNKDIDTYALLKKRSGMWTRVNVVFPAELGDVKLVNFKCYRCNMPTGTGYSGYTRMNTINLLYSPDEVTVDQAHAASGQIDGANNFVSIARPYSSAELDALFNNAYGNDFSNPQTIKTLRFCIQAPTWSGTPQLKYIVSEKYQFKLMIRKSNLAAWKAKYINS